MLVPLVFTLVVAWTTLGPIFGTDVLGPLQGREITPEYFVDELNELERLASDLLEQAKFEGNERPDVPDLLFYGVSRSMNTFNYLGSEPESALADLLLILLPPDRETREAQSMQLRAPNPKALRAPDAVTSSFVALRSPCVALSLPSPLQFKPQLDKLKMSRKFGISIGPMEKVFDFQVVRSVNEFLVHHEFVLAADLLSLLRKAESVWDLVGRKLKVYTRVAFLSRDPFLENSNFLPAGRFTTVKYESRVDELTLVDRSADRPCGSPQRNANLGALREKQIEQPKGSPVSRFRDGRIRAHRAKKGQSTSAVDASVSRLALTGRASIVAGVLKRIMRSKTQSKEPELPGATDSGLTSVTRPSKNPLHSLIASAKRIVLPSYGTEGSSAESMTSGVSLPESESKSDSMLRESEFLQKQSEVHQKQSEVSFPTRPLEGILGDQPAEDAPNGQFSSRGSTSPGSAVPQEPLLVLGETENPEFHIVLLHSAGQTDAQMRYLAKFLADVVPRTQVSVPQAPLRLLRRVAGGYGRAWYDFDHLMVSEGDACSGLEESAEAVREVIISSRVPPGRTVILGLDQGGGTALWAGLHKATTLKEPVAGIISVSGHLPKPVPFEPSVAMLDVPVVHYHYYDDPEIPFRLAAMGQRFARAQGVASYKLVALPKGKNHGLTQEVLQLIGPQLTEWLKPEKSDEKGDEMKILW